MHELRDNVTILPELSDDLFETAEQLQFILKCSLSENSYNELIQSKCKYLPGFPKTMKTLKTKIRKYYSNIIQVQYHKFKLNDNFIETVPYVDVISVVKFWLTVPKLAKMICETSIETDKYTKLKDVELQQFKRQQEQLKNNPEYVYGSFETGSQWLECVDRTREFWEPRILMNENCKKFY